MIASAEQTIATFLFLYFSQSCCFSASLKSFSFNISPIKRKSFKSKTAIDPFCGRYFSRSIVTNPLSATFLQFHHSCYSKNNAAFDLFVYEKRRKKARLA